MRVHTELEASDRDFAVRCPRRRNHLVLIALEQLSSEIQLLPVLTPVDIRTGALDGL
jgi:hypothetical protein